MAYPPSVPTLIARWALDGNNVVEPSEARKYAGWSGGEYPPSTYFNWYQRLVAEQVRYLSYDRIVDEDFNHAPSIDYDVGGVWPTGMSNGLYPRWDVVGRGVALTDGLRNQDVIGAAIIAPVAGSTAGIRKVVGGINFRDFIFEARFLFNGGFGAGPTGMLLGWPNNLYIAHDTGGLNSLKLYWRPSNMIAWTGQNATFVIPLNQPVHVALEREGATLTMSINGERKFSVKGDNVSISTPVEARIAYGGSAETLWLDKMLVGVRR